MRATLRILTGSAAVCAALGFGAAAAWAEPGVGARKMVCEEAGDRWACMSCCYDAGAAAYAWGSHYGCVCIFRESPTAPTQPVRAPAAQRRGGGIPCEAVGKRLRGGCG